MKSNARKRLGDLLIEANVIQVEQLDEALLNKSRMKSLVTI